jgi:flagellar biogenesis protein FliO
VEILRQSAAVCFVIGLAALAGYLSRRAKGEWAVAARIGGRGASRLLLIERIALTPHHQICIVQVDGRELVVGVSASGVAVLRTVDDPSEGDGR